MYGDSEDRSRRSSGQRLNDDSHVAVQYVLILGNVLPDLFRKTFN